ncbi:uncharacterized protein [Dysidea avara]|uniref:uncharacterized protein n=1 Tax=Dysidea avara TaxID=196820 RepID=UPI0033252BE3
MKILAFIIVTVLLDQVVSNHPKPCTKYGLELDHPGTSCDDIYEKNPASHYKSGLYVIKTNKVQLVYCDMSLECGSHKGGWMRIADLNSSRDNCPPGWINNQGYNSLCTGGSAAGCYSAHFTTDGTKFSRVCGMMKGYQKGSMDAFYPYSYAAFGPYTNYRPTVTVSTSLDGVYVEGVSITYGNPRKHIWTYAVGLSEDYNYKYYNCPCAKYPGPTPPPYIGNDYYCESGNTGVYDRELHTLYSQDPLWDGYNCPSENNCCNRPGMPWFFRQLPVKESAPSIEVRICNDQGFNDESAAIEQLQLYIQ